LIMDLANNAGDIAVDIELSQLNEDKTEAQRARQVPEQDPNNNGESPVEVKVPVVTEITSDRYFSQKQQRIVKIGVFAVVIAVLIMGRFSVPSNDVACVKDKAFEVLENITKYLIATPGHEGLRNALQIINSGFIDIVFLTTLGYWILHGRSSRLIVTYAIFYGTRALIQQVFWSPFPSMYWWENPGFPSLVVPYGRGSDFFFSGHSGFLVICINEWNTLGFKKIRNFICVVLSFTIFVLLTYRIHYTIDIFTGVFFADWCHNQVSKRQDSLDNKLINIAAKLKRCFRKK